MGFNIIILHSGVGYTCVNNLSIGCCKSINVFLIFLLDAAAFVEFDDDRDAQDSIRSLDGKSVDGVRLRVEFSKSRGGGAGGV